MIAIITVCLYTGIYTYTPYTTHYFLYTIYFILQLGLLEIQGKVAWWFFCLFFLKAKLNSTWVVLTGWYDDRWMMRYDAIQYHAVVLSKSACLVACILTDRPLLFRPGRDITSATDTCHYYNTVFLSELLIVSIAITITIAFNINVTVLYS
jgi:hypothetical protein